MRIMRCVNFENLHYELSSITYLYLYLIQNNIILFRYPKLISHAKTSSYETKHLMNNYYVVAYFKIPI